tara:strand:- start:18 stop:443 length:426 start_codon:yes stop_codon:yes gene_type:complete
MTDPFYIIYDSEDQAHIRSEQAGSMRGLSYSQTGTGSRYWWGWIAEHKEENARVAIALPTTTETETDPETFEVISSTVVAVDKDILTDEDDIVEALPSDWAYPPELEELEETPKRARDANGRFIADDPTTPDEDEAWTQPD